MHYAGNRYKKGPPSRSQPLRTGSPVTCGEPLPPWFGTVESTAFMTRKYVAIGVLFLLAPALPAQERVDLNVVHKIKTEELGNNSKVMEIMHKLTDQYGPRLTNSPQFRAAGDWAVGQMKEWGLANVHLEKWETPKDNPIPSWQVTSYNGAMVEPTYMPIIGVPVAWTGGTNGPVTGEAILAPIQTAADMEKFHGKLTGKYVLSVAPPELV